MNDLNQLGLRQHWDLPTKPLPIVLVGAGGIVGDAHLPAYRKAGFEVAGVFDVDQEKANAVADTWAIDQVYPDLESAVRIHGTSAVYDLATPPSAIVGLLAALPEGAATLIQKPMGNTLREATLIKHLAEERSLKAAINFQLRFTPMMLAVQDLLSRGMLGELLEVEVQVNIYTPWHLFPFLIGMERVEIAVHSIHYFDMIRRLAGEPKGVFCRTLGDPRSRQYAQTRTSAMLDYGSNVRVLVNVNHNHRGGGRFQTARFRLEGSKGSVFVKLGVLYDYPNGEPDEVWFCENEGAWQSLDLVGTWFPDGFVGTMSNVQRFALGEDERLVSGLQDAWKTMALVEACYEANGLEGVPVAGL